MKTNTITICYKTPSRKMCAVVAAGSSGGAGFDSGGAKDEDARGYEGTRLAPGSVLKLRRGRTGFRGASAKPVNGKTRARCGSMASRCRRPEELIPYTDEQFY